MPKVDFYVLKKRGNYGRARFVCRLADKILHSGHGIYIHTMSRSQAQFLDKMLWTFKDSSFLPHDLYPDVSGSQAPVRIGYHPETCVKTDVLINFALEVPVFFERFSRVAELTDGDPAVREAARTRYRTYRKHGCSLTSHNISH
ncbi:MAG: DNA polymerase III subunit chi [Gammaproteobacteria bacterium]|nr:DNA polymerase III subunit chi [Gammaproteobacteria bacterium]